MHGTRQMLSEIDLRDLGRHLLFRELDQASLSRVVGAATTRKLPPGSILFSQSDEPTEVHFIVSGAVKLLQAGAHGPPLVSTYCGPGSLLGCFTAFGAKAHVYTASAVGDVLVLSWSASSFEACLRQYPPISRNAMMIVSGEAQEGFERVREFASEHVEQRVAHIIGRLARVFESDSGNAANVWLPLSRQDLAEMSGATLFTVSRIMTAWEKLGILQSGRQRFRILDAEGLAKVAAAGTTRTAQGAEHAAPGIVANGI